jgi:acetate kinase
VLVVNSGSRSLKLSVVEAGHAVESAELDPRVDQLEAGLAGFIRGAGPVDVVGHRVVHGGSSFSAPVILDDRVRAELDVVSELAPLHNPPALRAIDATRHSLPGVPSIACFDTAFHSSLPPESATYAVPTTWTERWGIRRYGFHGISCSWSLRRAAELTGRPADALRLVVCHLGGGASVTAIRDGRSLDTTMGFTPLEGLVMATRSGDVDPGAVLWAVEHSGHAREVLDDLEHRSGLLGLSGGRSADVPDLLAARATGDPASQLAIAVYVHRLRAKIAAMTAAMGGIDVLAFTAGVGENAPEIRSETCVDLGWMGVAISPASNNAGSAVDRDISAGGASVATLVIHAREELEIAAECERLLSDGAG